MNTYETMKRDIPEGATHYSDESDVWYFSWFKKEGDKWFIQIWSDNGNWVACENDEHIKSEVKPIPTEAPEPTKTYRYEKVTDSIEKIAKAMIDGEVFYSQGGSDRFYWRLNGFGKNNLALTGLNGFDFYRRIEVTERELEIEAAKDLYDTYMLIWSNHYIAWDSLDDKNKKAFLAIVCKTGYRKDFNVVNGKG